MQLTGNYGLKKPDQNEAYNIQNENDNMDIIDKTMDELQNDIDEVGSKLNTINLDAANVSFTSSISAFTQKNVKLALDYLFQLANNGKQYWVDVVGIPLLVTDTFATLKAKTQTIKNTIAANIVSKGIAANNTDTLTSLADAISRISIESLGGLRYKRIEYSPSDIIIQDSGNGIEGTALQKTLPISFTPKFMIVNIQSIQVCINFVENSIFANMYDDHTETKVVLDSSHNTYIYSASIASRFVEYREHEKYLNIWARSITTRIMPSYVDIIY